jgi:hypothetical protein
VCFAATNRENADKNLAPARFFVFRCQTNKRDRLRSFLRVRKKQLSANDSCACINLVNNTTDRPLMNASTNPMNLLKTAHNAAVVVVRVVVVVGNAP